MHRDAAKQIFCPDFLLNLERKEYHYKSIAKDTYTKEELRLPFNLLKTVNTTAYRLAMKIIYFETQTWSWNH